MMREGYMLMGRPLSSLMLCVKIDKTPFTTIMYDFVQMHWISWTEMERRRESRYEGDNLYQGIQVSRYPGTQVSRYPGTKVPRYQSSQVPRWHSLSRWQTRWSPVSPVYLTRIGKHLTWWTSDAGEKSQYHVMATPSDKKVRRAGVLCFDS